MHNKRISFSRQFVLNTLESSFLKTARIDYGYKYTHTEEDIRASIYRYIRETLDMDYTWRLFLSYSTKLDSSGRGKPRPDMVFFRGDENLQNQKAEIFVEIKNWPTKDQIERDIKKLFAIKKIYVDDNPDIVFLAIIGPTSSFPSDDTKEIKLYFEETFKDKGLVHIFLQKHSDIYKGPWNYDKNNDPWLEKLR